MPKMGFRATGAGNVYVYLETTTGSSIFGLDTLDSNRLKISVATAPGLDPDSASPMLVLDPRTGGTAGEGDITLLPKGLAGSGNVSIDSGGLVVASLNTGVAQTDNLGFFSSTKGTDGQVLISSTAGAPAWATLTAGTGISISNSSNGISISANGSTVIETITGNTGGAISPTAGNINIVTANATAKFVGSGSTETIDFGGTNLILGSSATGITSATTSVGFGKDALSAMVDGDSMTAIGYRALRNNTGGNSNTAVGSLALTTLTSSDPFGYNTAIGAAAGYRLTTDASYNILIGPTAGGNYTGTESSNICLNNEGILGESNTLRIGLSTGVGNRTLTAAYICGIDGVNVGSVAKVLTMASDQLGTASIVAGSGLSVTPGANTITLAATGMGAFAWSVVVGTSQAAAVNHGYFTNNAVLVTVTLPGTAAVGDTIRISGLGAGGWLMAQNAGQSVNIGSASTTVGVGGSLASTARYDSIELVCCVANTTFNVASSMGNIIVL